MLDQNTDRMWYVIGAVIVGAAIILIVNSSMPQLFASVGGSMEGLVVKWESSLYVNDIKGNKLTSMGMVYGMFPNPLTGELSDDYEGRDYATSEVFDVSPGERYVFSTPALTYKYVLYYDENEEPILSEVGGTGSMEITARAVASIAPANAKTVRVSTRIDYTYDEYETYDKVAPVDTWWFGLTKDFEGALD